jgi:hypothetical protein
LGTNCPGLVRANRPGDNPALGLFVLPLRQRELLHE